MSPGGALLEGPPLAAPIPAVTVAEFIRAQARRRPQRTALVDAASGRRYRYGELDALIGRFAAGLAANGFRPGDTLLMFAPNMPEWPVAALGAIAAGGAVSGANPAYGAADLAHQARDCGARFIFTTPAGLAVAREAAESSGCEHLIVAGAAQGALGFDALAACAEPEPAATADADALAALPYSSGTTGLSKGVMLSHRTLVANVCQYMQAVPLAETAVVLAVLPMFHIYGFTVMTLRVLASGATLVTLPRFEPAAFLGAIQTHRVTHLNLVPPLMHFLASHPLVAAHDLSSLQSIGTGAAPFGAEGERRIAERFKCRVGQGFGMTESSGVVAATYPDRARPGSSGQLLPATQARVVDPASGADLGRNASGEIWFRGPQAFKGYLHQPAATAATLTADGWVRTGDIGHFDDDGYLYITDRMKELIKVKGFQVAPAELEALLFTHPAVADVAVIGRPDARAGEIPVAYVVGRAPFEPEQIKDWVAQRVVDYKQLGAVVACEAIPKTASGKILRRVLRERDAGR
ncbi:MAG: AMP-binding protein [Nevskia sp.]|nr:AMP-binding protein [Nevskia sp.]